jgi:hypothetical protein
MYNECRHIFISGKKCGSPALKDQNFCFYHTTARKRQKRAADNQPYDRANPKNTALALPSLDEGDAIQLAISEVVLALASNAIDPRRARILLYGLQIASQHYRHKTSKAEQAQAQPAHTLIREAVPQEDGSEIGPAKQSPDPEDLPKEDGPMTLGKFLLLKAIKKGIVDPEEIPSKTEEWKEVQRSEDQDRNKTDQLTINLQAVAETINYQPSQTPPNHICLDDFSKYRGGVEV